MASHIEHADYRITEPERYGELRLRVWHEFVGVV
jgi:hypothetical protein